MTDKPKTIADYALQGGKAKYATDWPAAMRDDARKDREKAVAEAALKAAQNRYVSVIPCPGCGDMPGGCTYCTPDEAQPDPLTVTGRLRWEHNKLYLGHLHIGSIHQFGRNADFTVSISQSLSSKPYPTEAAARAALVEAVKEAIGG